MTADADQRTVRILLALSVLAGALLSVQARINGALAGEVGSPVVAALVSFSVGTTALAALAVVGGGVGRGRRASRTVAWRWWWFCGGLGGAFLVSTAAYAVPRIGVALLGVGVVAGQTAGSLAVDGAGISPRGRQPLTAARATGALLAVVALGVGAIGRGGDLRPLLFAVIVAAGAGVAVQQAANGQLQRATGETFVAALLSFAVGTVALGVVGVGLALAGRLTAPDWPTAPGLYLGGLCGAAYIALSAAAVGRLGVLRLTLAAVAGQLMGAVALDALRPPAGGGLRAATVAATALTLVAVGVSGRSRR